MERTIERTGGVNLEAILKTTDISRAEMPWAPVGKTLFLRSIGSSVRCWSYG
jgi:hypothetical protein